MAKRIKATVSPGTESTLAAPQAEINKTDAVAAALRKLGRKAKPMRIKEFVQENFGLDLTLSLINNYKHTLNKKRGRKGKRTAGKVLVEVKTEPKPQNGRGKSGIPLQDIETVKTLTKRLGPSQVHALVDLISK